jgi:hypothetical protein
MDAKTPLGPNVKKLLSERCSQITVERAGRVTGEFGAVCAIASRLSEHGTLQKDMRDAFEWVKAALAAVRAAPDNKFITDEEIAGEILRLVTTKRTATRVNQEDGR